MARRGHDELTEPGSFERTLESVEHGAEAEAAVEADLEAAVEEPTPAAAPVSAYDEALMAADPVLREANAQRTSVRMAGHHLHLGDHPYARMIVMRQLVELHRKVDDLVARLEAASLIEPAKTGEKA